MSEDEIPAPHAAGIAARLQRAANGRAPAPADEPTDEPEQEYESSYAFRQSHTLGDWATERDSAAAFDRAVGDELWTVYRDRMVSGVLVHPRPCQSDRGLKIDRILVPKRPLLDAGWKSGVVGVEIKRSGVKIGPPIAQAMDYSRAVWSLAEFGNVRVWLDWVFVWPMPKQGGTTASVLAQNRIGSATPGYRGGYQFKSGESNVLYVDAQGRIHIGSGNVGTKVGSR